MKIRILALYAVTIFCSAVPFSAQAGNIGGSDGAGGNTASSDRKDLEEIVASFERHLWELSDASLVGGPITLSKTPLSSQLKAITRTVFGSEGFTINERTRKYIRGLKFEIVDRECLDGGKGTDASTFFKQNAVVCLSATRLARFPKSILRNAIMPLVFHEVAHQFGLGEAQAIALQRLAELNFQYRPIFLSAYRAWGACASVTEVPQSSGQSRLPISSDWPTSIPSSTKLAGRDREQMLMLCALRATSTGENLARIFNGDIWQSESTNSLTSAERAILTSYRHMNKFSFLSIVDALREPGISGYNDCEICRLDGIDPAYIMMLAAKAALSHIDDEVGRLQKTIIVSF